MFTLMVDSVKVFICVYHQIGEYCCKESLHFNLDLEGSFELFLGGLPHPGDTIKNERVVKLIYCNL